MSSTILVAEDEPIIRLDISDHLSDCGFDVLQAGNAASAIHSIEANPHIKLVFTDVRMPGEMDGIDLTRWIMKNRPDVAVIIASGGLARQNAMDELCVARTFSKPYSFHEVSVAISEALGVN